MRDEALGHSKLSITLDTYGHLMPEMQNEAADLMDELVTPIEVQLHQNCTKTAPRLYDGVKGPKITPHI